MTNTNNTWQHIRTLTDGEPFEIHGLRIWEHDWKNTGENIRITDPLYGQEYIFTVYKIHTEQTSLTFAAGEFSNCVWGIYLKSDELKS